MSRMTLVSDATGCLVLASLALKVPMQWTVDRTDRKRDAGLGGPVSFGHDPAGCLGEYCASAFVVPLKFNKSDPDPGPDRSWMGWSVASEEVGSKLNDG